MPTAKTPRLPNQVDEAIRLRQYSRRTERAYAGWIWRFVEFQDLRHPRDMGELEVTAFLTDLTVRAKVSASPQNQALSAPVFPYREVLPGRPTRVRDPDALAPCLTWRQGVDQITTVGFKDRI